MYARPLPARQDHPGVISGSQRYHGTVNAALREARLLAGFSQYDLARAIRHRGFLTGRPNGCTRERVRSWENGKTRRPHPVHLFLLEDVLGQPAANLGFDADLRHGMSRAAVLAEAGLDAPMRLPDPASSYGGLSGIWLSGYTYVSSGRKASFSSQHYVVLLQTGAQLTVRSVPKSSSGLSMTATVNGHVVTGTWTEQTRADGYYRGAAYMGAIQLLEQDEGLLAGKWLGFGKGGEINDGPWTLRLADRDLTAISRWDVAL
jgi:transcriptional regulator with XRE-family HTH domain